MKQILQRWADWMVSLGSRSILTLAKIPFEAFPGKDISAWLGYISEYDISGGCRKLFKIEKAGVDTQDYLYTNLSPIIIISDTHCGKHRYIR